MLLGLKDHWQYILVLLAKMSSSGGFVCHYQLDWITTFECRFQNRVLDLNPRGGKEALSTSSKNIQWKKSGFRGFNIWLPVEGTKYLIFGYQLRVPNIAQKGFSLHWLLTMSIKGHRLWTLDYWPLTCLVNGWKSMICVPIKHGLAIGIVTISGYWLCTAVNKTLWMWKWVCKNL